MRGGGLDRLGPQRAAKGHHPGEAHRLRSANYRVYDASAYSGIRCGGYVRWGGGTKRLDYLTTLGGGQPASEDVDTSFGELGFLLDWGVPFGDGLFINPHVKIAVGSWDIEGGNGVSGIDAALADFVVGGTMHVAPSWLFGVTIIHRFFDGLERGAR